MAIKAKFSVDNKELKKGLQDAENQAKSSMDKIADAAETASGGFKGILSWVKKIGPTGKIAAVAIGLIGAAVAGTIALLNKLAGKMDDIAKTSKSVNMSTAAFQELSYAAGLCGVAIENVVRIVTNINYKLSQASSGAKAAVDAFAALGISWSELIKLNPEQQLLEVIKAAEKITNISERNQILFQLFEKEDINILNKLMNADFGRLVANAKSMGIVIDEDQLRAAEAYNDALSTANQRIIAMAANLKETKEAMEFLAENAEAFTNDLSTGIDGRVDKRYAAYYEGIGDAADALQERLKKNDRARYDAIQQEIRKLAELKAAQQISLATGGRPVILTDKQREDYIQANMQAASQEIWFREVSYEDPRFNPEDRKTWTQRRLNPAPSPVNDPEKIKADQVAAAVKRLTDEYDKKKKKHEDSLSTYDKELDYRKEIAKIEKETGSKLTDEQILQVKNALLEYQIARNQEIIAQIQDTTEAYQQNYEIQKALLEGDTARVEKLKMINQLRKQGLIITEEDFDNNAGNREEITRQIEQTQSEITGLAPEKELHDAAVAENEELKKQVEALLTKEKSNLQRQSEQIGTFGADEKEIAEYEKRRLAIAAERYKLQEKIKANELIIAKTQGSVKKSDDLSQRLKEQQSALSNADAIEAAKEQLELQEKLKKEQEELQQKKNVGLMASSYETQNEILKAQLAGDLDRVNTLKLINELKAKGIDIDEEELKKNKEKYAELIKQKKEQQELNLKGSLKSQGENLQIQAMKAAGYGKQAAELEAIRNAEKAKGAKLTEEEAKQVKKLASLQYDLANLNTSVQFTGTMTNELASRGGFSSSVVSDDRYDVNQQILTVQKAQEALLRQIETELKKMGVIS